MALKTFVTGEVLTAADVNTYLVNNIYIGKNATESVTSSTTYQDDDQLTLTIPDGAAVYEMTCGFFYDGDTAGDLKYRFSGPAGSSINASTVALSSVAASVADLKLVTILDYTTDQVSGCLGNGNTVSQLVRGLVVAGATGGTFKLQWAQNSSHAVATRIFGGSFMGLRRVS